MNRLTLAFAAVLAVSCGGSSNGTRYFRMLFPSTTGMSLPDTCYQAASLAPATMADQIAAESYCKVGKKGSSSSGTTSNTAVQQSWTMVDTGESKLYLVTATSTGSATGVEGSVSGSTYSFAANNSSFTKQCTSGGAGVTECNGTCVNTRSDKNNCGSCGFPCPGSEVCRQGVCVPMCPSQMLLCGAAMTNVLTDNANCGFCGRACTGTETCSNGICLESACQATCSDKYQQSACGAPRQFSKDTATTISFEISGGAVKGQAVSNTTYACTAPGCASDFDQRCPACSVTTPFTGREVHNVTEFESR